MTPDQLHQVLAELGGLASYAVGSGWWKKHISKSQTEAEVVQVDRLETAATLMREEMDRLRNTMVRLEVRMEVSEKVSEQHRSEMYSLSRRVDESNSLYSEMLDAAKARASKTTASQTIVEPGKKPDLQDQTKMTIKGEKK